MSEQFKLLPEDIHTPLWRRLSAHLEERIAFHRKRNDGGLSEVETAKLRGRIAEAKYILEDLGPKPAPLKVVGDVTEY